MVKDKIIGLGLQSIMFIAYCFTMYYWLIAFQSMNTMFLAMGFGSFIIGFICKETKSRYYDSIF